MGQGDSAIRMRILSGRATSTGSMLVFGLIWLNPDFIRPHSQVLRAQVLIAPLES